MPPEPQRPEWTPEGAGSEFASRVMPGKPADTGPARAASTPSPRPLPRQASVDELEPPGRKRSGEIDLAETLEDELRRLMGDEPEEP